MLIKGKIIEPRMIMACPMCGVFVKATMNRCPNESCKFDVQEYLCSEKETHEIIMGVKRVDTNGKE